MCVYFFYGDKFFILDNSLSNSCKIYSFVTGLLPAELFLKPKVKHIVNCDRY